LAPALKNWSQATFGLTRKKIWRLEQQLFYLPGHHMSEFVIREERDVECALCELFECEVVMARQ
jgi:hypothetical protein